MEPVAAVILLVALGAMLLAYAVRAIVISIATFDWPSTRGAIATAEIDELRGQVRIRGKQLWYTYNVEDQTFSSNRVYAAIPDNVFTYAFHFYDREFVERNYDHLEEVEVYYNPDRPGQSCLRQGGTKYVLQEAAVWLILILFLVFFVIGVDA